MASAPPPVDRCTTPSASTAPPNASSTPQLAGAHPAPKRAAAAPPDAPPDAPPVRNSKRRRAPYREVIASASDVEGAASFAASGTVDDAMPGLALAGVGPVALPLTDDVAPKIVAVAARSPFGRRDQTLLDEQVRRSWEVEPAEVTLGNAAFRAQIGRAAQEAAAMLGVDGRGVRATLYKLLLYDTGAFFLPHRDTEKEPGMFATLVVVLPSVYTGGELVVRHGAEVLTFDLAADPAAAYRSSYVAFFADCVHEVRPITSGCRLVLVYNM